MPWTPYKLGKKSDSRNWTNPDCQLLETISHVAHFETAARILKDGKIRSNPLHESSLRVKDISVTWFSANSWVNGSRYGNIEFVFNFKELIKDRNIYWTGVKRYEVDACCFLITDQNLDKQYNRYDPGKDKGPFQYFAAEDAYYWNGKITLEFIIDDNVPLGECGDINFVLHHHKYCSADTARCCDKAVDSPEAGRRFISNILANNLPIKHHHFRKSRGRAKDNLALVFDRILRIVSKYKWSGPVSSKDDDAEAMLRSALNFLHLNELDNFKSMAIMFKGYNDFEKTLVKLISEKFKITNIDSLYD